MAKVVTVLVLIAAAFVAGWYPQSRHVRDLTSQLDQQKSSAAELQEKLQAAEVRDLGAMLYLEVVRQNHAQAAGTATKFFDGVRELAEHATDAGEKSRLENILSQRDGVTANIALAAPTLPSQMQAILLELHGLPTN